MKDFWTQLNYTKSHINIIGPDGHTWAQVPNGDNAEDYAEQIVRALKNQAEDL